MMTLEGELAKKEGLRRLNPSLMCFRSIVGQAEEAR